MKEILGKVRGCSPLVAFRKSSISLLYSHRKSGYHPLDEETRTAVQEWVENTNEQQQDLLVEETFIGGFEWPSVLFLNFSRTHETIYNLFQERNCIMRTMSRLVVLDAFKTHIEVWNGTGSNFLNQ